MTSAALLSSARRVVVKVGSSLLIQAEGGVRAAWLAGLADDIVALREAGKEVVVVSSGAVVRMPPLNHVEYGAADRMTAPGLFSTARRVWMAAPTRSMPSGISGSK